MTPATFGGTGSHVKDLKIGVTPPSKDCCLPTPLTLVCGGSHVIKVMFYF